MCCIPQIALVDRPPHLTWPHVERDGVLCLLTETDSVALDDIASLTTRLLADAAALVNDCIAGRTTEEFRKEANTYWNQGDSAGAAAVISLVAASGPNRPVHICRFKDHWIVADDEDRLIEWVRNRASNPKAKPKVAPGHLIWLPNALIPSEFPQSAADLYSLVERYAPDVLEQLKASVRDRPYATSHIVVGADTDNGPFVAAMAVPSPPVLSRGPDRPSDRLPSGFRNSRVPPDLIIRRYFGAHRILRSTVERADAKWVHGRGHNANFEKLSSAVVTIIGCGSLGSGVAQLLAQSGVGQLNLIDPDLVRAPNAARHVLGMADLLQPKVRALKANLQQRLPHLKVEARHAAYDATASGALQQLNNSTIVVAAVAAPRVELALNHLQRASRSRTPVIYSWMEPHALAGHAVLIGPDGACLRCGMNAMGGAKFTVTSWNGASTTVREPACGAFFQPYGAIDLSTAVALTADLALQSLLGQANAVHRIRVGSSASLQALGGTWTPEWTAISLGRLGETAERSWPYDDGCPERHG